MAGQISQFPTLVNNAIPGVNNTSYFTIPEGAAQSWLTTETSAQQVATGTAAWAYLGWILNLASAPGVGTFWTFILRVNGLDTPAQIQISGTNTTGSWTGSVTINPGDLISVRAITTNSAAAFAYCAWTMKRQAAGTNETFMMSGTTNTVAANTTHYSPLMPIGLPSTFEEAEMYPHPIPGTIKLLYVTTDGVPGGTGLTVTLRTATQTPAGTAISPSSTALTCTVGAAATTATDLTHSVTVVAGQRLDWQVVNSAGGNAVRAHISAVFAPTDGTSCVMLQGVGEGNGVSQFCWGGTAPQATEAASAVPHFAATFQNMYCIVETNNVTNTAIGAGETGTWTLRNSTTTTDTTLTTTVTGSGTSGNNMQSDLTDTVTIVDGTLMNLHLSNTSAAAVGFRWGYAMSMNQGGGTPFVDAYTSDVAIGVSRRVVSY